MCKCNISLKLQHLCRYWHFYFHLVTRRENIFLPKRAGCLFSAYDSFPLRPSISPQLDAVLKNRFSGLKRFFANFQTLKICNPSITAQLIMCHPKFQSGEFFVGQSSLPAPCQGIDRVYLQWLDQLIRSATQFSGQLERGQRQDRTSAGN